MRPGKPVPRVGDPLAVAERLAATPGTPPAQLARAADAIFEVADSRRAVPLLVRLLGHARADVRAAAARALAAHPFPAAARTLAHMAGDPSDKVREAAAATLERFDEVSVTCLACGGDGASLGPEPSSDPHGDQLPRPAFCDEACAVAWALGEVRDNHHVCVTLGRWSAGTADECPRCVEDGLVGSEDAAAVVGGGRLVTGPAEAPQNAMRIAADRAAGAVVVTTDAHVAVVLRDAPRVEIYIRTFWGPVSPVQATWTHGDPVRTALACPWLPETARQELAIAISEALAARPR